MQNDERDPIVSLYCLQLGRIWWETMGGAFVIMSLPNSCWETELHYAQWSLIDDKNPEYVWFILRKFSSINDSERSESPGNTGGGSVAEDNRKKGQRQIFFHLHCKWTAGFNPEKSHSSSFLHRPGTYLNYHPMQVYPCGISSFLTGEKKNWDGIKKKKSYKKILMILLEEQEAWRFSEQGWIYWQSVAMMSFHLHNINVVQA